MPVTQDRVDKLLKHAQFDEENLKVANNKLDQLLLPPKDREKFYYKKWSTFLRGNQEAPKPEEIKQEQIDNALDPAVDRAMDKLVDIQDDQQNYNDDDDEAPIVRRSQRQKRNDIIKANKQAKTKPIQKPPKQLPPEPKMIVKKEWIEQFRSGGDLDYIVEYSNEIGGSKRINGQWVKYYIVNPKREKQAIAHIIAKNKAKMAQVRSKKNAKQFASKVQEGKVNINSATGMDAMFANIYGL